MSSSDSRTIESQLETLSEEGIDRDLVIEAMKEAVRAAARKQFKSGEEIYVEWSSETGIELFASKVVVEEVTNPARELSLKEARERSGDEVGVGDELQLPLPMEEMGRIAAQTAKQILFQKVRDAVRAKVYEQYIDKVGDLVNGYVKRFERGDIIVDLGTVEAILYRKEQSRGEHWGQGERIRVVIDDVAKEAKGPQVEVSRRSPELLRRLFEMEVPEIYDETVIIKSAVREPGERAKIAVASNERDVDPIQACMGARGSRVQAIIRELRGEKIDIIEWSDDPLVFAANALSPAKVNQARITDIERRQIEVIVNEDQLNLAIGKRGQNVRLATKLVGWNIDIHSEEELKKKVTEQMERIIAAGDNIPQTVIEDVNAATTNTLAERDSEDLDTPDTYKQPSQSVTNNLNLPESGAREIVLSAADDLTPNLLENVVVPYLKAISEIQHIINEIRGHQFPNVVIKSIKQESPISVNLNGASDAIQLIKETISPWRRKHAEKMSHLIEKDKEAEIANKKADILEKRARANKDHAEAEKIGAEAAKQRAEAERMGLENDRLRVELNRAKIQLALEVISQVSPTLSETDKIAYVIKLLPSLGVLISSELEIVTTLLLDDYAGQSLPSLKK